MKTYAAVFDAVKIVVAMPCIMWGGLIGVIGIGPCHVPTSARIVGVLVFFGALAAAYPFSLFQRRASVAWAIFLILISTLPLARGIYAVVTTGWPSFANQYETIGFTIEASLFILYPLLTVSDYILSRKLFPRNP